MYPGFWLTLWRIYRKDTRLEWKNPAGFISTFLFAVTLAALYHYSMDEKVFQNRYNLNGILLATLFFSSTIVAGRNIHFEKESGALRVVLMSPLDSAGYFLGKTAALFQLLIIFIILYTPVYFLLLTGRFVIRAEDLLIPCLFLSAAALSLSALGIILTYVASGNRMKDLILPLLILPASIPVFMLANQGLHDTLNDLTVESAVRHLIVLLAPGAIYCSIGCLLYSFVAADE